jgi:glyoxylase-like metal-dependent hydrolase (beta-lactamase superfamily II)
LGQVHRIDERTLLVQGQELNIDAKQPDVANAVLHRTGDTVVIVDTGVTEAFRKALRGAVDEFVDAKRLLLLTTHCHTDHVGNNDLVDDIASERGIVAEHFVPARDVGQMLDPVDYWTSAFSPIVDLTSFPARRSVRRLRGFVVPAAPTVRGHYPDLRRASDATPRSRPVAGQRRVLRRRRGECDPQPGTLRGTRDRLPARQSPVAPG